MWKKRQASDSWVGKELEAYLTEVAYLEEEQGVNIAKSHEILKRTNKINFKKIASSSRWRSKAIKSNKTHCIYICSTLVLIKNIKMTAGKTIKQQKRTKTSNHKAHIYTLGLQNWLQDANLEEVGFLLSLSSACADFWRLEAFVWFESRRLAFPIGAATIVLFPRLCCPFKGKAQTIHSHLHPQTSKQQANVNMLLLSECLSFAGATKSKLCKKTEPHIQKQVGWEWFRPTLNRKREWHVIQW